MKQMKIIFIVDETKEHLKLTGIVNVGIVATIDKTEQFQIFDIEGSIFQCGILRLF